MLLLEGGFELRVAVRPEGGPVEGGFQPFAVGRAEPELHRQAAFADVRVRLERETLVELHLQLGGVRLAVLIARLLGIQELQFPAIRPGNAGGREFIEPAELFLGQALEERRRAAAWPAPPWPASAPRTPAPGSR